MLPVYFYFSDEFEVDRVLGTQNLSFFSPKRPYRIFAGSSSFLGDIYEVI